MVLTSLLWMVNLSSWFDVNGRGTDARLGCFLAGELAFSEILGVSLSIG
jgi:hypothetical protein